MSQPERYHKVHQWLLNNINPEISEIKKTTYKICEELDPSITPLSFTLPGTLKEVLLHVEEVEATINIVCLKLVPSYKPKESPMDFVSLPNETFELQFARLLPRIDESLSTIEEIMEEINKNITKAQLEEIPPVAAQTQQTALQRQIRFIDKAKRIKTNLKKIEEQLSHVINPILPVTPTPPEPVKLLYTPPTWSTSPITPYCFDVFQNSQLVDRLDLMKKGHLLIGRLPMVSDVIIDDPTCSRQHAILQFRLGDPDPISGSRSDEVYIYDLGSTGGTFVNQIALSPLCYYPIFDGDIVQFGQHPKQFLLKQSPFTPLTPLAHRPTHSSVANKLLLHQFATQPNLSSQPNHLTTQIEIPTLNLSSPPPSSSPSPSLSSFSSSSSSPSSSSPSLQVQSAPLLTNGQPLLIPLQSTFQSAGDQSNRSSMMMMMPLVNNIHNNNNNSYNGGKKASFASNQPISSLPHQSPRGPSSLRVGYQSGLAVNSSDVFANFTQSAPSHHSSKIPFHSNEVQRESNMPIRITSVVDRNEIEIEDNINNNNNNNNNNNYSKQSPINFENFFVQPSINQTPPNPISNNPSSVIVVPQSPHSQSQSQSLSPSPSLGSGMSEKGNRNPPITNDPHSRFFDLQGYKQSMKEAYEQQQLENAEILKKMKEREMLGLPPVVDIPFVPQRPPKSSTTVVVEEKKKKKKRGFFKCWRR